MLLTITTCKRLEHFKVTIDSLVNTVNDLNLIDRVCLIDNNSPLPDVEKMRQHVIKLMPNIPIKVLFNRQKEGFCHTKSMNMCVDEWKDEEFVFHCEDDWLFINKGSWITWALDTLKDPTIGQCCFTQVIKKGGQCLDINTVPQSKNELLCSSEVSFDPPWPSQFTLNPCIMRIKAIKNTGLFKDTDGFEVDYGNRWIQNYKTIYHPLGVCKHQVSTSAYALANSLR